MSILELDQSYETPVTELRRGPFKIRYAYARSRDCQDSNENGQDYLIWRAESYRIVFALCDGVGQSFFGGIAAQILGEVIVDWLWKVDLEDTKAMPIQLTQDLHKLLDSQRAIATKLIDEKDITSVDNEIIRDALETRRKQKGTQSNFVCGLIDPPNQYFREGRVLLFWLGDAKLQIWQGAMNNTARLNADWNSQEGWSSRFGIAGEIHSFRGSLQDLNCVIAHSDGLDPLRSKLTPSMASGELDNGIKSLRELPSSDDVSFLEISVVQPLADSEDDLVSRLRTGLMRNSTELPVKVLRQVEKVPVEKQITKIETNEKKVIPRWLGIIIALLLLAVIVSCPVGYYFGHINITTPTPSRFRSTPSSPTTQQSTPMHIPIKTLSPTGTSTVFFTSTPSPTETSISVFTPTQVITGNLPLEEIVIISLQSSIPLKLGCNDFITMGLESDPTNQIKVFGLYEVKAYSDPSCQGSPTVIFFKGAIQPLGIYILSLRIDAFPYP